MTDTHTLNDLERVIHVLATAMLQPEKPQPVKVSRDPQATAHRRALTLSLIHI